MLKGWMENLRIEPATLDDLPELADLPIHVEWADANVRNELAEAQTAEAHQRLGVPQEELWRRMGYTPEQIDGFKRSALQDKAAQVATITAALRVDQGRQAQNVTGAPSNGNGNGIATGGNNGRTNPIVAR